MELKLRPLFVWSIIQIVQQIRKYPCWYCSLQIDHFGELLDKFSMGVRVTVNNFLHAINLVNQMGTKGTPSKYRISADMIGIPGRNFLKSSVTSFWAFPDVKNNSHLDGLIVKPIFSDSLTNNLISSRTTSGSRPQNHRPNKMDLVQI